MRSAICSPYHNVFAAAGVYVCWRKKARMAAGAMSFLSRGAHREAHRKLRPQPILSRGGSPDPEEHAESGSKAVNVCCPLRATAAMCRASCRSVPYVSSGHGSVALGFPGCRVIARPGHKPLPVRCMQAQQAWRICGKQQCLHQVGAVACLTDRLTRHPLRCAPLAELLWRATCGAK